MAADTEALADATRFFESRFSESEYREEQGMAADDDDLLRRLLAEVFGVPQAYVPRLVAAIQRAREGKNPFDE